MRLDTIVLHIMHAGFFHEKSYSTMTHFINPLPHETCGLNPGFPFHYSRTVPESYPVVANGVVNPTSKDTYTPTHSGTVRPSGSPSSHNRSVHRTSVMTRRKVSEFVGFPPSP